MVIQTKYGADADHRQKQHKTLSNLRTIQIYRFISNLFSTISQTRNIISVLCPWITFSKKSQNRLWLYFWLVLLSELATTQLKAGRLRPEREHPFRGHCTNATIGSVGKTSTPTGMADNLNFLGGDDVRASCLCKPSWFVFFRGGGEFWTLLQKMHNITY